MKNLMNIISPLLITTSLTLTACGGSDAPENTPEKSNTQTESTSKSTEQVEVIDASKNAYTSPLPDTAPTYTVATMEYVPFAFKDEYGKPVGYDVDMIRAIGEEAGFKVKMSQVPFSKLFGYVQNGEYDLAMSGLSVLPERQALMAYSESYSKGRAGYLVQASAEEKDPEQLKNKKIAVLENSSLHEILKKQGSANLDLEKTMFLTFQAIFDGHADVAFNMEPTILYQADQFSEMPVEFIPASKPIFTTIYAGKDKQDIIVKINDGLNKIKANGRYHKINEKWFGNHASDIEVN